ncbi:MAG: ABC transporter permease subunit [Candidatus Odinarchaeota archaeon]
MIIAVGFGIILGRFLANSRGLWYDRVIQLTCIIGISLPIFFLGILFQYYLAYENPIFPATYYKDISYEDPPLVTGFYIIDAIISRQFFKIPDYIYHLILPISCLTIISFSLVTIITRSYMLNQSRDKSVVSNTVVTGIHFSLILMFTLLVDITFGLFGSGSLLIEAMELLDYWVISAMLNVTIIMFVVVMLISNLAFIFYKLSKRKKYWNENEINLKENI